jgi:hypothetical protein
MHFVQDYEAWFHPTGDQSVAALGVHHLGLATIVIGNWLQAMLWTKHQLPTWSIPFTADAGLYRPHGPLSARPPTVVGMFQPEKYRRCAGLMRAALQAVLAGREDVQVITVGSAQSPDLGPRHRHLGLVSKDELPTIYRASAVGFSLSSTNPSRVPFEMMASGLPVVEFGGENTVFDLPGDACVLANPDPASMASAILTLVNDESRRTTLAESGVAFMKDRESAREGEAFVAAVRSALAGEHPVGQMPIPVYRKEIVAFEPRVPWSGDHAHAELGEARNDPLAKQLEVNGALNEVNVELNRVNQELNAANHVISHDNDVISAENAALSAENARLAETLASVRLRYNRTLEGRLRRRIGREP